DLHSGDGDGEVPWSDRDDDAKGLAPRIEERRRTVALVCLAVGFQGLRRVIAEYPDRSLRLPHAFGERLALLAGQIAGDTCGPLLEKVGGAPQDLAPRGSGSRTPSRVRRGGRAHGVDRDGGLREERFRYCLARARRVRIGH